MKQRTPFKDASYWRESIRYLATSVRAYQKLARDRYPADLAAYARKKVKRGG